MLRMARLVMDDMQKLYGLQMGAYRHKVRARVRVRVRVRVKVS